MTTYFLRVKFLDRQYKALVGHNVALTEEHWDRVQDTRIVISRDRLVEIAGEEIIDRIHSIEISVEKQPNRYKGYHGAKKT